MNAGNVSLVQQNTMKQNEHMNAPLVQQNKIKRSGCWKCSFISQKYNHNWQATNNKKEVMQTFESITKNKNNKH